MEGPRYVDTTQSARLAEKVAEERRRQQEAARIPQARSGSGTGSARREQQRGQQKQKGGEIMEVIRSVTETPVGLPRYQVESSHITDARSKQSKSAKPAMEASSQEDVNLVRETAQAVQAMESQRISVEDVKDVVAFVRLVRGMADANPNSALHQLLEDEAKYNLILGILRGVASQGGEIGKIANEFMINFAAYRADIAKQTAKALIELLDQLIKVLGEVLKEMIEGQTGSVERLVAHQVDQYI